MNQIKTFGPVLAGFALAYYGLPLLGRDTGSYMVLLLALIPLLTFLSALYDGIRWGFRPPVPLLAAGLFAPTVFLYYNLSAWVYIPIYGVAALLGSLLGGALHGGLQDRKNR